VSCQTSTPVNAVAIADGHAILGQMRLKTTHIHPVWRRQAIASEMQHATPFAPNLDRAKLVQLSAEDRR
jgi:hypothetical protein